MISALKKLFRRKPKFPTTPNAGTKMRAICILNESKNPDVTRPLLEQIAHACYRQLAEHYAPFSESAAPDSITVAMTPTEVPKDAAVVYILDTPDEDGALGYHYVLPNGMPIARIFTKPILDNGGTLTKGANSLSQTISHEILEMAGDPYANFYADMPDGKTEDAVELCDRVENDSYDIDGVAVSNFLGPRAFREGDGPYDYMGLLKAPFDLTAGGYAIRRVGGPAGKTSEIFGMEYPEWKKQLKKEKRHSRAKKRAKLAPELAA